MATDEDRATRNRFADRYGEHRADVVQRIERAVIGGDWGAEGYTTVDPGRPRRQSVLTSELVAAWLSMRA
jgi:hypothetical protein